MENHLACCYERRELCKQISSFLPKRILDIRLSPDTIKLVETEPNSSDRYVALSYCWGITHPLTTTILSIEERKSVIEMSFLPKTFKDAIFLTRRLGLRYIWIDSLCIIQDSAVDWEVESAKMATVYEQAYLTIAVSSSSSCDKPFRALENESRFQQDGTAQSNIAPEVVF